MALGNLVAWRPLSVSPLRFLRVRRWNKNYRLLASIVRKRLEYTTVHRKRDYLRFVSRSLFVSLYYTRQSLLFAARSSLTLVRRLVAHFPGSSTSEPNQIGIPCICSQTNCRILCNWRARPPESAFPSCRTADSVQPFGRGPIYLRGSGSGFGLGPATARNSPVRHVDIFDEGFCALRSSGVILVICFGLYSNTSDARSAFANSTLGRQNNNPLSSLFRLKKINSRLYL